MKPFTLLRVAARPRNIAVGLVITSPALYWLAFSKDNEGNPRQARYWQVKVYEFFPLRIASRLWGSFNSITLPVWFRPYGFRLYSWLFGVNINEVADSDLTHYANLGEFFYRKLKPDARPIANALVVSPSDGKVLQCGQLLDNAHIEKVKGVSYPLQKLIGETIEPSEVPHIPAKKDDDENHGLALKRHEKFAEVNGISYTVDKMLGTSGHAKEVGDATDAPQSLADTPFWMPSPNTNNRLYYCVIYLAPGDYHRFHSPVPWVVNLRRHFSGELFSVAPYFQERMANLFCLNERVALLGKWKYGFFSMTPVGATNVGSIIINFDHDLKTNRHKQKANTCEEANYHSASLLLRGYPLNKGAEMGGFRLGSTVVLVFEAPDDFEFLVKENAVVKMGEPLGTLSAK